ncbi:latent-transforming growth factor beta-binding protein 2-like [Sycon ciliatum]|uniref:latent-transforming growth factor beta-binding protein 2-like n=1 Tax=Sycon ciliatum TaxID=27933 RepID=UPI0031F643DD
MGYRFNGTNCIDVDECLTQCKGTGSECTNTIGSFTCKCITGYKGDGFTCDDVDECLTQCKGTVSECTNTIGSFTCKCITGYKGDGFTCDDVDECLTQCKGTGSECTNTIGNFTCKCITGYNGNGFTCYSQVVVLLAVTALQSHTGYYLSGSSTAHVGQSFLPSCVVFELDSGASGQYIQLINTNTNATVAEQGAFTVPPSGHTLLYWNTSSHDTLDPTYTGLYRCITDTAMSEETYQINVVVPPTILSFNTSHYVDNNNTIHPISCTGQGYPEPTVTLMVNNVVVTGTATSNCTAGVCTKTRTASLDGSTYTPGQSINITCTVDINQPPFTCTATNVHEIQARCYNAAKTTSQTRTVPVVAPCPLFDPSRGYDFNATFSNASGTVLGISCRAGFTVDTSMSSIDTITCQGNRMWTPLPNCTDVNECLTKCSDSSISQCQNTMGSFTCTCNMGYRFNGTNCIDIDECNSMCDSTSSQCNNTLGSYSCICNPGYTADGTTCAVAIPSGKSRVSGGAMAVMASLLVIVLI